MDGQRHRFYDAAVAVVLRGGKHHQADALSPFAEPVQIALLQVADAAHREVAAAVGLKGQRGRDDCLVGRIDAVDVGAGVSFGIAGFLGCFQRDVKIQVLLHHLVQDIVARAVEDAADAGDRIDALGLHQPVDPWDAAAAARLKAELHIVFARGLDELFHMRRHDRLVGRHDVAAGAQRL